MSKEKYSSVGEKWTLWKSCENTLSAYTPHHELSPCVFHAALSVAESPPLYYVIEHQGPQLKYSYNNNKIWRRCRYRNRCPKWVCIPHDFNVAPLYISDFRLVDLLLAPLEAVPKAERKKIPLNPVPSRAASLGVLWTYLRTVVVLF